MTHAKIKCDLCTFTSASQFHLFLHHENNHIVEQPISPPTTYPCDLCGMMFGHSDDLNAHIQRRHTHFETSPPSSQAQVPPNGQGISLILEEQIDMAQTINSFKESVLAQLAEIKNNQESFKKTLGQLSSAQLQQNLSLKRKYSPSLTLLPSFQILLLNIHPTLLPLLLLLALLLLFQSLNLMILQHLLLNLLASSLQFLNHVLFQQNQPQVRVLLQQHQTMQLLKALCLQHQVHPLLNQMFPICFLSISTNNLNHRFHLKISLLCLQMYLDILQNLLPHDYPLHKEERYSSLLTPLVALRTSDILRNQPTP